MPAEQVESGRRDPWLMAAFIGLVVGSSIAGQQQTNPRQQPGAAISMFAPEG